MRHGYLASLATLFLGAAWTVAQSVPSAVPAASVTPPPPVLAGLADPGLVADPAGLVPTGMPAAVPPPAPLLPFAGVSIPDGPNAFTEPPAPAAAAGHNRHLLPEPADPGRIWAGAEYLLWSVKRGPIPVPLVTTGTASSQGVLGADGTSVLFGQNRVDYSALSGGRFVLGFANADHTAAIEVGAFLLETGKNTFTTASDAAGNPLVARPFINSLNGQPTVSLVSQPGSFAGSITATSTTDFWGAEANLVQSLNESQAASVEGLIGFRYLNLEEKLLVSQSSVLLPGGVSGFNGETVLAPAAVGAADTFSTRNEFYGGQFGLQVDFHPTKRLLILVGGNLGLGAARQTSNVTGQSTLIVPGTVARTAAGGILAPPAGALRSDDEFAVVPEGKVSLGFAVTQNVCITVGYTFLYWDDVLRPGEQVNLVANPSLIPTSLSFGAGLGTTQQPHLNHSDFWAQGLNVGVAIRY